jgi:hypothetical protein
MFSASANWAQNAKDQVQQEINYLEKLQSQMPAESIQEYGELLANLKAKTENIQDVPYTMDIFRMVRSAGELLTILHKGDYVSVENKMEELVAKIEVTKKRLLSLVEEDDASKKSDQYTITGNANIKVVILDSASDSTMIKRSMKLTILDQAISGVSSLVQKALELHLQEIKKQTPGAIFGGVG